MYECPFKMNEKQSTVVYVEIIKFELNACSEYIRLMAQKAGGYS